MGITDTYTGPFVRQDYDCPARDFSRSVGVGVGGESAAHTLEVVSRLAVGFGNAAASRTSSTGVERIDELHRHTDKPAFVGDLGLEILEGPRMQDAPLDFSSPDPSANVGQVFHSHSASGAFSHGANLFGNQMVLLRDKAVFAATKAFENTAGGSRALLLKALALAPPATSHAGNLLGVTKGLAIGRLGNVDQTEVYTKPFNRLALPLIGNIDGDVEIEIALPQDQIRLSDGKGQEFAMSFTANEREMFDAASYGPNADGGLRQLEVQDAAIVGNRSMLSEGALRLLVEFVSIGDFGIDADHHLRGEIEFSPNGSIEKPVHREPPKLFGVPCQLRQPVCGSIGAFQCAEKRLGLFSGRQQFDLDGQYHSRYNTQMLEKVNQGNFLPPQGEGFHFQTSR